MLNEFKKFALKGNIVDLAVAVLIGAAFGKIVEAFTDGIITPILSLLGGTPDVSLKLGIFNIGMVLNAVIAFLITAAVLFFIFIKPMNRLTAAMKTEEAATPAPEPTAEVKLLEEIRDLLKSK